MALELLNTIPFISLAGNKIPLRFGYGDNMWASSAGNAVLELVWGSGMSVNSYFDIIVGSTTMRFYAKDPPQANGEEIWYVPEPPSSLQLEYVAAYLQYNYFINKNYIVTTSGLSIIFTARYPGPAYNITFEAGPGVTLSAGALSQEGIAGTMNPFYNVVVSLYVDNAFVTELALNCNTDGIAETDVSKILGAYLQNSFLETEDAGNCVINRSLAILPWSFGFSERWGTGNYSAIIESGLYYVMVGGINKLLESLLTKYNTNFFDEFLNPDRTYTKFLTNSPQSRTIGPEEKVKLYFPSVQASGAQLKVTLYTATSNTTVVLGAGELMPPGMLELIVSPLTHNFEGLSDKSLVYFNVYIADMNDAVISTELSFNLDYKTYEHARYFLFKNSLGCYEYLRTVGLGSSSEDFERETAKMNTDIISDQIISVSNFEKRKFKVSTGWLPRSEDGTSDEYRAWLREFALSTEVYQVLNNNDLTLIPIRITSTSIDNKNDRDNFQRFVFEYENAFSDEFSSPYTN